MAKLALYLALINLGYTLILLGVVRGKVVINYAKKMFCNVKLKVLSIPEIPRIMPWLKPVPCTSEVNTDVFEK